MSTTSPRSAVVIEPAFANSVNTLLVSALSAMAKFNRSLLRQVPDHRSAWHACQCLHALADCAELAPELRDECEQLAHDWARLRRPPSAPAPMQPRSATVHRLNFMVAD